VNTAQYPLGVDVLFFDQHAVVGLPRTVKGR
jgi:alpha-D-ribose 1-methylphosphonate 5-triphosphate synthase subunit PhnH